MKKPIVKRILIAFFLVVLLTVWLFAAFGPNKETMVDEDVFEKIYKSPCAKFESLREKDKAVGPIIIDSSIRTLSGFVSTLPLKECNDDIGDVVYRITFNCKEKCGDMDEIVVLVGKNAVSINGVVYGAETKLAYKEIKDIFDSKWDCFSK